MVVGLHQNRLRVPLTCRLEGETVRTGRKKHPPPLRVLRESSKTEREVKPPSPNSIPSSLESTLAPSANRLKLGVPGKTDSLTIRLARPSPAPQGFVDNGPAEQNTALGWFPSGETARLLKTLDPWPRATAWKHNGGTKEDRRRSSSRKPEGNVEKAPTDGIQSALFLSIQDLEAKINHSVKGPLPLKKAVSHLDQKWKSYSSKLPSRQQNALDRFHVESAMDQVSNSTAALALLTWARGRRIDLTWHQVNAFIAAAGRAKDMDLLDRVEGALQELGLRPQHSNYGALVFAYHTMGRIDLALQAEQRMLERCNMHPDAYVIECLMSVCNKEGLFQQSVQLFEAAQLKGVALSEGVYTCLIYAYGQLGYTVEAERAYAEMLMEGLIPGVWCATVLMDILVQKKDYDKAQQLFDDMRKGGVKPHSHLYTTMINCYWRQGDAAKAEELFQESLSKGYVDHLPLWSTMVHMAGQQGDMHKAVRWFQQMVDCGVQPTTGVFCSLLSNFVQHNMYRQALVILNFVTEFGPTPDLPTFSTLLLAFTASEKHDKRLLLRLMKATKHKAYSLLLCISRMEKGLETCTDKFHATLRDLLQESIRGQARDLEFHRAFAETLLRLLCRRGLLATAVSAWETALQMNIFEGRILVHPDQWKQGRLSVVDLHNMATDNAVLVTKWALLQLRKTLLREGKLPGRLLIITGWGKNNTRKEGSSIKEYVIEFLNQQNIRYTLESNGALNVDEAWLRKWIVGRSPHQCALEIADSFVSPRDEFIEEEEDDDDGFMLSGMPLSKPRNLTELLASLLEDVDTMKAPGRRWPSNVGKHRPS